MIVFIFSQKIELDISGEFSSRYISYEMSNPFYGNLSIGEESHKICSGW